MPTHFPGTEEETRALNAYITLLRAADSVVARLQPRLTEAGLTWTQFGALEALLHLGPMNQGELGRKLLKSGGNLVVVIDHLEARGWVRRERRGDDRRCVTVHLTGEGRKFIEEVFPGHLAGVVREMGVLSPGQQETLRSLCRTVGRGRTA